MAMLSLMHDLDRSILATLGYYGVFGRPLTVMEISERLIPAKRLGGKMTPTKLPEIIERLNILAAIGTVKEECGLYALSGTRDGFAISRIEQEKIWAQKWRRMLRKAYWLQAAPFVRALCASGSLALGSMSPGSDWDVFVIAESGRLFTARTFLLAIAWLFGVLRKKNDKIVSDKFCFNHYVATGSLNISHRSIFTSHALAGLIPVIERGGYLVRFWQANNWIGDYRPPPKTPIYARHSARQSIFLDSFRKTLEFVLASPAGDLLEIVLRVWQQRRIKSEPATYEPGGRIVANQSEIEFHPRSFEAIAISRYNQVLDRFGFGGHLENNSGLN